MRRRDRQTPQSAQAQPAPQVPADADAGERPSKSQRKRDMTELQALGEQLLALPPHKLRALPVPEDLLEAIELARRITSREGLRRQRQYIGRLMRDIDPAPLREALDVDGAGHRAEVALMHAAEHWRDRLLAEPAALAVLAEQRGLHDTAEWTRLVDEARAEQGRKAPGRRYRELYRRLREALSSE